MLSNRRQIQVEWGDCDPAGIVFNPHYFAWFDGSVHALLATAGLSLRGMMQDYGIHGLPLVDTRAKFYLPTEYGDQLSIETAITQINRCAFDITHRVFKDDALATEGFETRMWTAFDPAAGRVRAKSIPEDMIRLLSR